MPRRASRKGRKQACKGTQIQSFLLTHRCHRLLHLSSSNTEQNRRTTEGKDICGLTMLSLVPPPHLRIGRLLRPARRIVAPRGSGLRARGRPGCYLDPPRPSPELSYPCGTIRDGSRAQTPTLPPTGACLSGRGSEEPSPTLPPHPAPPAGPGAPRGPLTLCAPHCVPVPNGAALVAAARYPPSPCWGAARTRSSSRWRR